MKVLTSSWRAGLAGVACAAMLSACSGLSSQFNDAVNRNATSPPQGQAGQQLEPSAVETASLPPAGPGAGIQAPGEQVPSSQVPDGPITAGQVTVGLILPLTASGNAAAAAKSMKNAADMAIAEFKTTSIQLLVKDDGGSAQGAQRAAQQAFAEGAEIIIGPLFAQSVGAAGQTAKGRGAPMIAFSTDSNVASRGVYLLSFLPESDVDRIVDYAMSQGKKSFVGLLPSNAYGSVAEAEFKQAVSRRGGRIIAIERYGGDRASMVEPAKLIAQAASQADALLIPDAGNAVPAVAQTLASAGVNLRNIQLLGTGLWDDPRIFGEVALEGGWYAAPDAAGFRAFSTRYRARYGEDPVRTATLAYDAVALVAAIARNQKVTDEILTNPSGFAGIDGVFRFRADGTNQRGLAVFKVTSAGAQAISPAPKTLPADAQTAKAN